MVAPDATAQDCYDELKTIAVRLDELHAGGRLTISRDPTNTQWTNLNDAVTAATAALDVAIQALAWIETTA